MSLKQEIETWVQALAHYDNNEFEEALKTFDGIADTSRILFNCGVIYATLGEHEKAVDCYQRAVRLDQYLAVSYFQQGVSNFLLGDFEEALANFNDTLLYLRGNTVIDYEQLGLKFKLYSCEVLFNRGLCYIYLQQKEDGLQDLTFAAQEKFVDDHNVIDEAILEEAEGYTVFSIPVGVVYRPNSAKVKNLKTKDYLGKARLVAATATNNTHTGFTGAEIKRSFPPTGPVHDDRPIESISFAASNLVKPGLRSRMRQQSEPPLNRHVFPPTPPPESDKISPRRRSNERDRDRPLSFDRNAAPPAAASESEKPSFSRAPTLRSDPAAVFPPTARGPDGGNGGGSIRGLDRTFHSTRSNATLASVSTAASGSDPARSRLALSRTHTESTSLTSTSAATTTERGASLRARPLRPLQLEPIPLLAPLTIAKPDDISVRVRERERPRLGTSRTASEPRGPSRRYGAPTEPDAARPRLASRERVRHSENDVTAAGLESGASDGYAPSAARLYSRRAMSRARQQHEFIEEEDDEPPAAAPSLLPPPPPRPERDGMAWPRRGSSEDDGATGSDDYEPDGGAGDAEAEDDEDAAIFQALSQARATSPPTAAAAAAVRRGSSRAGSRKPDVRKIRIKVHVAEDTRYILTSSADVHYDELIDRVRDKFRLHDRRFRCTVRDDGDVITLGDQDDLDMAVAACKANARREGAEMGKMELWVMETSR
ncbi:MAG: hypothetical protein M1826_006752 [Phylliscum demangeonii]|nr:MAG: hypothetical protein M1826_006752 [Phylliscum demangeonii]